MTAFEHEQPEPGEAASSPGIMNLLQIAWQRRSLVMLGVVGGLIVGGIAYVQKPPTYQTNAQLIVIKKQGNPLSGTDPDPRQSYYEDYVSTHQVVIKSPVVVANAVQKRNLTQLTAMNGVRDPILAIRTALTVQREGKDPMAASNVLNLSYRGPKAEDCAIILDSIIDSYKDFLDETYKNVSNTALTEISRAAIDLQKNLDLKVKGYEEFQAKAPVLSAKGIDGRGIQEVWITQLYNLRLSQLVRRAELRGRIDALETAIKEGRGRQVLMVQLTASANRTGASLGSTTLASASGLARGAERKPDEQLYDLLLKEQALLSEYGPQHPEVVAVRKRMELTRDYFARDNLGHEKGRDLGVVEPVQWHLQAMKQELADVEVSIQAIDRLTNDEQTEVRELIRYRSQDRRHQEDIERAQKLFEPIIHRLEEIKLVRDLGGFDAKIIAQPEAGLYIGPFGFNYLVLGGFFGLLSGLGLAYVADMRDKTFRTPEEIRRRLGLTIIGHIPVLQADPIAERPDGIALDPYLCTFLQAKSTQAEAFRGVRTALYFSVRGEVHQVIQVTSPNAGDGKSTVIANLAISIAQSGKRVVLVDADFRKPRQHKMFGISAATGLASVIAEQAELKDAIHDTVVPGLALIPCGPRPDNPAELLTSPRFKELLDVLRDQYDYVLIDTPPLLAVSDPSVVAPRADGVILAVRVSANGRPAAERAKEILNTLNTKVLGVVVNGVGGGPNRYGYNYGSYAYQYAYQYASGYYQDEEAKPEAAESGEDAASPPPPPAERKREARRQDSSAQRDDPSGRQRESSKEGLLARLWPWGR